MPHIYIYQCNEWNNSKHVREKESFLATKTEAILKSPPKQHATLQNMQENCSR